MPRESQGRSTVARRPFLKRAATGSAALGMAGLAGCMGDDDDDEAEDIIIGGVMPYTGPFVEVAEEYEAGLQFWLDRFNEESDLENTVVFESVDSETDPSNAATLMTQLIEEDDASIITGPVSSDVGIAAREIAEDHETPLVFTMVGDGDALSSETRHAFRLGLLPAPTTAQSIAQFLEERDLEIVRALIADYAYGHAFDEAFDEFIPDDIDFDSELAPFMEDDFSSYLRDMPDDVDVIIGTSHPPGSISIMRETLELGLEPEYVLGNSEANPNWTALGEDVTEGWLSIHQPYPYSDEYEDVAEEYGEETGNHFGVLASLGYSAGQLMTAAIEEVGGPEPTEIADAIREGEVDTLFNEPIQYTERGELNNKRQVFSGFEAGAPDYFPDGEFTLTEEFLTDPIEGFDGHAD